MIANPLDLMKMNNDKSLPQMISKLIDHLSLMASQSGLGEEASDLKAISFFLEGQLLSDAETADFKKLFEKYQMAYSTELTSVVSLAVSIIEPTSSPFTDQRELGGKVSRIRVSSSVNVRIIQGEKPGVRVVAHSKRNASKMITREDGNTLYIEQEPTVIHSRSGATKIIAGRVGQVLSSLSGAMNINMSGGSITINGTNILDSEYIEITVRQMTSIELQGSSDVSYENFNQKDLSVSLYGSGDVYLSGTVDYLNVSIMSSGDVKGKNLIAKNAKLGVMGSGTIKANVANEVEALVTGSGHIKVAGNPVKQSRRVVGSGSITIK